MAAARTPASCKLARAALARFAPPPAMASPCASLLPASLTPAAAPPAPTVALLGQVRQLSLGAWPRCGGRLAAESAAVGWSAQRVNARSFRSSVVAAASADSGLAQALQAEIKHEAETYEPVEDAGKAPPAPFTVESTPGAQELVLRRSFEGEDIAVIVSTPEEEDDDLFGDDEEGLGGEGGQEESGEQQEEEDDGEEEPFLPVRVNITKKAADGTLQVMEVDCGVEGRENQWVIEAVRLESADVPDESVAYDGPDYYTLDPSLQEQFEAYLERRGFTPELGKFIRASFQEKEQEEYVAWLGRVAKFVS